MSISIAETIIAVSESITIQVLGTGTLVQGGLNLISGNTYRLIFSITGPTGVGSLKVLEGDVNTGQSLVLKDGFFFGTVTTTFTSLGATKITFAPIDGWTGSIDSVSLRAIYVSASVENKPISEFLVGTTDRGKEIFFRADTKAIHLVKDFEMYSNPISIINDTERGTMMKCFISVEGEQFFELEGTVNKGVSILKIESPGPNIVKPVVCRHLRISWRDSSKQLCRLLQSAIVFLPTTIEQSE